MKVIYKGTEPIDVKVPRNNGAHIDTITVRPSENPYETADQDFVAAALSMPELFATPDEEQVSEELLDKVDEITLDKPEKKKKDKEPEPSFE